MRPASPRLCLALRASLAGCTLGPDFMPPDPPKTESLSCPTPRPTSSPAASPAARRSASCRASTSPASGGACSSRQPLNRLIETRAQANPDIQAAAAGFRSRARMPAPSAPRSFRRSRAALGASQNQTPSQPVRADGRATATSTACSRSGSRSPTSSTCGAPTAAQIELLEALAEAQCFQLEGAYLSLASNVVAAAIHEASLRAQIEATQRIIAAQRDTLDILNRQSGLGAVTGADVASPAGRARPGRSHPAAAAEGAGAAAQPARHPDRPAARPGSLAEQLRARRPAAAAGPAAQPAVEAGRAAARRPRGRGQPPFGLGAGRRRRSPTSSPASPSAPASTPRR